MDNWAIKTMWMVNGGSEGLDGIAISMVDVNS
jgi:hypothetical protein